MARIELAPEVAEDFDRILDNLVTCPEFFEPGWIRDNGSSYLRSSDEASAIYR